MMVSEVMTRDVECVLPGASVAEIVRKLLARRVGALPVVDADRHLLGLVSEYDLLPQPALAGGAPRPWWADLLQDPETRAAAFAKAHGRSAREIMTARPTVVAEDMPVERVARLMQERGIKHLPVVRDGRLVGIVARSDLLRVLAMSLPPQDVACGDDMAIKDALEARARASGLSCVGAATVVVEDGVVHLWGVADSAAERQALALTALEIAGVRGIENHLAVRVPDPTTDDEVCCRRPELAVAGDLGGAR